MSITTENNGRSEGYICEQFAYPSKLVAYPSISDITESGEMLVE